MPSATHVLQIVTVLLMFSQTVKAGNGSMELIKYRDM
jgi:hypothetical protein